MLELELVLDFECGHCGEPVAVTLKCEGKGLASRKREWAAVKIPCPHCQLNNQLVFDPKTGDLNRVTPEPTLFMLAEPSYN